MSGQHSNQIFWSDGKPIHQFYAFINPCNQPSSSSSFIDKTITYKAKLETLITTYILSTWKQFPFNQDNFTVETNKLLSYDYTIVTSVEYIHLFTGYS